MFKKELVIPRYEPSYPGYRFPECWSVGELYSMGKSDPCGDWAMKDIWSGGKEKVHCMLPFNHYDDHDLPHIDFDQSKAWQHGWITDVWYKDKSATNPLSTKKNGR